LLTENAPMACSQQMADGPSAEWFQAQALKSIGLALRAKDAWTKWRYALEAEQWFHLAELQAGHLIQTRYQGVERRINQRHLVRIPSAILMERDSAVDCTVRDLSATGIGLLLPDTVSLPAEIDLTFNRVTSHCKTVWRHTERIGLKFA
jgi:PilZ domain